MSCTFEAGNQNSPSPSPTTTPATAQPSAGKITEIAKEPVSVLPVGATQEIPAKERMELQVGETIRTQGDGSVQVELNNGLAFRVGGDSAVILEPNNQLNLTKGEMITWVQPGKKVPAQIVTPAGVAGIRGTTVYVQIPPNPQEGTLFFAWEGNVSVKLPGQTSEIPLKTGEEVTIKRGEKDFRKVRSSVKQMKRSDWLQLRQCIPQAETPKCSQQKRIRLFRNFKKSLPTLPLINK